MKITDIQKHHDIGPITGEQRQNIVEQFQLKEDGGNDFLAIVSIIGTVLTRATSRNRRCGEKQIPISLWLDCPSRSKHPSR
jgi:hypothetical protein